MPTFETQAATTGAVLRINPTPSNGSEVTARNALVLDVFRQLQAAAMGANAQMSELAYIGYGDGAHNPDNTLKPFDATREAMFNLVVLKELSELVQPNPYSARAKAVVRGDEIGVISEAALFDADRRIVAMAIFPPKYTTSGETYGVTMQLRF